MYASIVLIIFNIIINIYIRTKTKNGNDYIKEKNSFLKLKTKIINRIINISYLLINSIHYILLIIEKNNLPILEIILSVIALITYLTIEIYQLKKIEYKLYEDKYIKAKEVLLILSSIVIITSDKTKGIQSNINNNKLIDLISLIFFALSFILILLSIVYIVLFLINNKQIVKHSITQEEYLEDINYSTRIQLNKTTNYIIYIFAYLVFVYINIPYIFILYIIIFLVLVLIINKKYNKIKNQNEKLYKTVAIAKNKPGIVYAFQFTKDILLLKKLIILLVIYTLSITSLYGLGESAFALITVELYIFLLYIILEDKKYLIRYMYSLNDSLIDEETYNLKLNKKISYIDIINILEIKLYKIIIIDNITYKSNIILYDPEININNIDIITRKDNIDDYITIENNLYEDEE